MNDREEKNLELPNEISTTEYILAAKFLKKRALSVEAVIKTFSLLWRSVRGFEVRRVRDHVLLFMFDNKEEVEKIINNAPWSLDKHFVVMQWYDRGVPIRALSFDMILVWVQVHDILVRFLNRKVAKDLCDVVGSICSIDDVIQMDGGSFMRVKLLLISINPFVEGDVSLRLRENKGGFLLNTKDYLTCVIGVGV